VTSFSGFITTHPQYLKVEFSNADDESYRDRVTQEFVKTDKYSIAFATSALGQGIDKSNIRVQISWGSPGEIDNYIQAFGRAGRAGLQVISILYAFNKQLTKEEFTDQMVLQVTLNSCRRKSILNEFEMTIDFEAHNLESCCDFCAYNTSVVDEKTKIQLTVRKIVPCFMIVLPLETVYLETW